MFLFVVVAFVFIIVEVFFFFFFKSERRRLGIIGSRFSPREREREKTGCGPEGEMILRKGTH